MSRFFVALECVSVPERTPTNCIRVQPTARGNTADRVGWEMRRLNSWTRVFHGRQCWITQTRLSASRMNCWHIVNQLVLFSAHCSPLRKSFNVTVTFDGCLPWFEHFISSFIRISRGKAISCLGNSVMQLTRGGQSDVGVNVPAHVSKVGGSNKGQSVKNWLQEVRGDHGGQTPLQPGHHRKLPVLQHTHIPQNQSTIKIPQQEERSFKP